MAFFCLNWKECRKNEHGISALDHNDPNKAIPVQQVYKVILYLSGSKKYNENNNKLKYTKEQQGENYRSNR